MNTLLAFFFIGFLLIGCNSAPAQSVTTAPAGTLLTQTILATPEFMEPAVPSLPNTQLPSNPDAGSNQYCKPPYAILPVKDGNDNSADEINW